jgi:hypothetical protein
MDGVGNVAFTLATDAIDEMVDGERRAILAGDEGLVQHGATGGVEDMLFGGPVGQHISVGPSEGIY